MPKTDNVRQVDLPRSGSGGSVYIRGGNAGGVSNADTVDGYHASSTPTAGKLLALDASAQFDPSVIEWADVAGAGLGASGDTLVVQWGSSPTTIVPDASTAGGSAATSARSDHIHAIAAAAPTSNLTVTSANAEGNATSFARSNHTHAITTSANPGAAASILASDSSGYLRLVRLGLGVAPSYALHAQSAAPQLRIQSDASHYATFGADGSGNLTILPSGNSLLLDGDKTLSSDDWASQTTGWGIYPESTHGRSGYADFRYIYADELHVKAFIADLEQALAGGQIISKSVAILAADFTMPAKGTTAYFYVEDLPGTTAAVFQNADWVRIRNISRAGGGLVVADAYGQVDGYAPQGNGTQRWRFIRPAGDTGSALPGAVVKKGGLALDYGVSGNGFWEVTTLDPAGSPYAQVATWATHPQNQTVRVRLGNLDGIAGIGAEWGLWAGTDVNHQFKASSAGVELRGIPQYWLDASNNTRGQVDPTATGSNYLFWLGPSSGDKRFGVDGNGVVYIGSIPSQHVAGWAHGSDTTKIDGGDIYAGSVTAAQMSVTGFNLVDNPGFEYWSSTTAANGWTLAQNAARWGSSTHTGKYCVSAEGNETAGSRARQDIRVVAGASYYMEGWAYLSSETPGVTREVRWIVAEYDAADSYIRTNQPEQGSTIPRGAWTKQSVLFTTASNCAYVRVYLYAGADLVAGEYARGDDVSLRAASGMNLVVGTAGSARVEINNSGIEGYDSSGDKQFYVKTSDGRAMFAGGEGVLDKSGLVLSGDETSYSTYNAVRWMMETDPPGGNEVARIAAGRLYNLSPMMQIDVNRVAGYANSIIEATARGSASSAKLLIGGYSGQGSAHLSATHSTGGTAEWSVGSGAGSSPLARGVINDTAVLTVSSGLVRVDGFLYVSDDATIADQVTASTVVAESRVGIGYSANPPSYSLHIANSDTVKVYQKHTATTSTRTLVVNRRNSVDNGFLEWFQEFSSGDAPTWNFIRVNRPDGSGAQFLTAVQIGWTGNVWIYDDCSAASFTDRTPYPDRDTALAAVRSMRQAKRATGGLDHEALHEYVRSRRSEPGRNLSATVSAQNVVIQELLDRIERLEKGVRA